MPLPVIQPSTLKFLKDIEKNNNRDWFNSHKDLYLASQENMWSFIDALIFEMRKHDEIENTSGKESLYRIYNDVRFSKNKSPYKTHFAFGLTRATKFKRGGYYAQIKPGESFLACGFYAPNPADLHRIRRDILMHTEDWRKLLASKKISTVFGAMQGDKVTTAPRGFDKSHPGIDLIRHKQFFLRHDVSDADVLSKDFIKEANKVFRSVRPFFDYVSEVLTTNADGESIFGED
jgi:uncharacterized protein (TIGR02453 family)